MESGLIRFLRPWKLWIRISSSWCFFRRKFASDTKAAACGVAEAASGVAAADLNGIENYILLQDKITLFYIDAGTVSKGIAWWPSSFICALAWDSWHSSVVKHWAHNPENQGSVPDHGGHPECELFTLTAILAQNKHLSLWDGALILTGSTC